MKKLFLILVLLLSTFTMVGQGAHNYDYVIAKKDGQTEVTTVVLPIEVRIGLDGIDLSVAIPERKLYSKYNFIKPTFKKVVEKGVEYMVGFLLNLDSGHDVVFIMEQNGTFTIVEDGLTMSFFQDKKVKEFKKFNK